MAALQSSGALSLLTLQNYMGGTGSISLASYVMGQSNFLRDKIIGANIKNAGGRGYVAGGQGGINPGNIGGVGTDGRTITHNTINSFEFSSQQFTIVSDVLAVGSQEAAGVSSSTKGYFCGGTNQGTTGNTYVSLSSIYSLSYTTETTGSPAATLSVARQQSAGVSSTTRGYIAAGIATGSYSTEIDGIVFATETSINPAAVLSSNATSQQTPMNSPLKGYLACGTSAISTVAGLNTVDAFTFSTESVAALVTSMGSGRYGGAGFENSTQGYCHSGFAKGTIPKDFGSVILQDTKLLYSTEVASTTSTAPTIGGIGPGISSSTDGYAIMCHGGGLSTYSLTGRISTINFATDTPGISATSLSPKNVTSVSLGASNPTVSLTNLNVNVSDYYSSVPGSCGFVAGGGATPVTTISAFGLFSLFVRNSVAALPSVKRGSSGVSSKAKGYVGGGSTTSSSGSQSSTVGALTFTTETTTTVTSLTGTAFENAGSFGNRNTGWFVGGQGVSAALNDIRYITYSTETTATESAVLAETTAYAGSTSARAFGYLSGGSRAGTVATTTVSTFDFYTRIVSSTSLFLTVASRYGACLNSGNAVYCMSGTNTSGTPINTLDRCFNTAASIVNLSSSLGANFQSAGFYTPSMGYIVGGASNQVALDNINFVTETSGTSSGTLSNLNGAAIQSNNL